MSPGRAAWVKVRASEAERAKWHAKARTWTVAHAEVERERTRELARVGNNLNQIARWANTHKGAIEAVEVIGHLIAIKRALAALSLPECTDDDAR